MGEALDVIAVLAAHGEESAERSQCAYQAGSSLLSATDGSMKMPDVENWGKILDRALPVLDQLNPVAKETLVRALILTVMADDKIVVEELELLRVVCSVIHVPLPMITGGETS